MCSHVAVVSRRAKMRVRRDLRLDFLRGLAIYMIFVDHVSGDPLAKFTYHMIGFSDAAELFVFVSGVACGIAYSRVVVRQGLYGLTLAIAKRVLRIYAYYVLSSVTIILLAAIVVGCMGVQEFGWFRSDEPIPTIASALVMITPVPFVNILVLYIFLTTLVVPPLVLARGRWLWLVLTASAFIWVCSQALHPSFLKQSIYFNPFAWQFLFAIGVTLGISGERDAPIVGYLKKMRWPLLLAWIIVIGALAIKVLSSRSLFNIAALRLDPDIAEVMKQNLSPVRLAHFLSVAALVVLYFSHNSLVLKSRAASPLIKMGAHSLQVFSLSLVLTYALNIFVLVHTPSLWEWFALDTLAFVVLALAGIALARREESRIRRGLRHFVPSEPAAQSGSG